MAIATKTVLKKYIELTKKKRAAKVVMEDLKDALANLEKELVEQFQREGVQNLKMDGYTVGLVRKLFASAKDKDKERMITVLQSCRDATWSWMVQDNVNAQRLAARVRECNMDKNGLPVLPEDIEAVITVSEVFSLSARKVS